MKVGQAGTFLLSKVSGSLLEYHSGNLPLGIDKTNHLATLSDHTGYHRTNWQNKIQDQMFRAA